MEAEPRHDERVKALHAEIAGVRVDDLEHLAAKFAAAMVGGSLDLHDHGHVRGGENVERVRKARHALLGAAERILLQLGIVERFDRHIRAGHAADVAVVRNDNDAVLCETGVELCAVSALRRGTERRERVFGNALRSVVQPAVGDVLPAEGEALSRAGAARRNQKKISGGSGADGGRGDRSGFFALFHWYHLIAVL